MKANSQQHPAQPGWNSRLSLAARKRERPSAGYLLIECLVYMSVMLVLLGVAYCAFYRFMDYSRVLRGNSDDIAQALHAGELWRADLRAATGNIRLEAGSDGPVLIIPDARSGVTYRTTTNAVLRRVGSGAWATVLHRVKASAMSADARTHVTAWRWELELQPRSRKPSRVRPLFTFTAVPQRDLTP